MYVSVYDGTAALVVMTSKPTARMCLHDCDSLGSPQKMNPQQIYNKDLIHSYNSAQKLKMINYIRLLNKE